jgi:hypothetical protein
LTIKKGLEYLEKATEINPKNRREKENLQN